MAIDPLPYVAPVFLVALVLENGFGGRYSRRSLISALGCAAFDQITAAWSLVLFVGVFTALHTIAPIELSASRPLTWVIAIVGHDLAYYIYHRASHRVNVLWAAHVVHHQPSAYDFTVSLRQGAVATWITYVFYLPLAVAVDAEVFLIVHAAYQIYQFFVHTRFVRTLGPLEWLFATPSHHRVHHGCERSHLDKNYGGFFIIFDRLLGTFENEDREPRYGVPGGYEMVSPLFANFYMFGRLVASSGAARARGELGRLWFGSPESNAQHLSSAGHSPRVVEQASFARTWLPLAASFAGTFAIVFGRDSLPLPVTIFTGVLSVALLELASAPLDGR